MRTHLTMIVASLLTVACSARPAAGPASTSTGGAAAGATTGGASSGGHGASGGTSGTSGASSGATGGTSSSTCVPPCDPNEVCTLAGCIMAGGTSGTSGGTAGGTSGGSSGASTTSGGGTSSGGCAAGFRQVSNGSIGAWGTSDVTLPMDVDGDGKSDLVVVSDDGGTAWAQLELSTGQAFSAASASPLVGWASNTRYLPMDVNGDGKIDLVTVWQNGQNASADVSLSTGSALQSASNASIGGWDDTYYDLPMDVNGDGKTDLVVLWNSGSGASAQVTLSNGTGFQQVSNNLVGGWDTTGRELVGDINGDGKTDLVRILPQSGNAVANVWLSNGTGFALASANSVGGFGTGENAYQLADVNGDGMKDLVILWVSSTGQLTAQLSLSNGTAFQQVSNGALGPAVAGSEYLFEDVDGDGKTDLVWIYPNAGVMEVEVWRSTGSGFVLGSEVPMGGFSPAWLTLPGDVNGDGKGDLVVVWQDPTLPAAQQARAQLSLGGCLASATAGSTGGTTTSGGTTTAGGTGTTGGGSSGGQSSGGTAGGGSTGGTTTGGSTGGTGGGPIGPNGGSVGLLHFGASGDTRPGASNGQGVSSYPTAIIDSIAQAFAAAHVQFVVDMGDHMNNWQDLTTAQQMMALYQQAMALYPGQWFLTMGNHECDDTQELCIPFAGQTGDTAGNFTAYLAAVAQTGVGSLPWYSFDVQTSLGLARFVIIADNAWCPQQASWLDQTLTAADTAATYTIVVRHHPPGDTSNGQAADLTAETTTVRAHKFSLWLTGHVHEYDHLTGDSGRSVIAGIAGAPLGAGAGAQAFYGYLIVDQLTDGTLEVTAYDVSTGGQMDQFTVGPN
ncbi:MAG: FG-GAP-like repeat-containing protein [Deltaproteobacteria bacterium]